MKSWDLHQTPFRKTSNERRHKLCLWPGKSSYVVASDALGSSYEQQHPPRTNRLKDHMDSADVAPDQQMNIIMDINFYCLIIFSCSTKCETSGRTSAIISGTQIWTVVPEQWFPASSCYNMVARWPKVRHHHGNGTYYIPFRLPAHLMTLVPAQSRWLSSCMTFNHSLFLYHHHCLRFDPHNDHPSSHDDDDEEVRGDGLEGRQAGRMGCHIVRVVNTARVSLHYAGPIGDAGLGTRRGMHA